MDDNTTQPAMKDPGTPKEPLTQSFSFEIDDNSSQLSVVPQTNNEVELSIPREIISTSVSSTKLQSEILRPIIAGTYNSIPAYLLKAQFQFQIPDSGPNWFKRITAASISIVVEDAPFNEATSANSQRQYRRRGKGTQASPGANPPAIIKTYPGEEGWQGPISTAVVSNVTGAGIKAGWIVGGNADFNHSRKNDYTGTAKVMTLRSGGAQRNNLLVTVVENPVDGQGIPSFLVLPFILTHQSRRFSMRVTVKATFGFWRGKLAESIPVLGRVDEPLFFDPTVLQGMMEKEERGIGGVKIVEGRGSLEEVDLQEHSSLSKRPDPAGVVV
jgi:hypothetical protein